MRELSRTKLAVLFCLSFLFVTSAFSQPATVTIDQTETREEISKYIYGQFIEHLGQCIYGGIWAEMLEDRKFYYPVPAESEDAIWRITDRQARVLNASPWQVIGPEGTVTMVKENSYVGRHTPHINVAGSDAVGIFQGELGVVEDKQYSGYVILSGGSDVGPVTVSLAWDGGSESHVIEEVYEEYVKVPFMFTAGASTDNARLEITAKGQGTLKIATASIMPADNIDGFRRDTFELLQALDSPVYRWPGGNFVSGYDWRDGIGPRDKRPTRTNPAWTGIETNDMGLDEFIHLCRLLDTEPMIAVNTGFGDAYSAAAEVEYANGDPSTEYGEWRARNGHPEPYDVEYWCVGNEMFGRWQLGYMEIDDYVLKHNLVEEKMREVDPSITTIGVGEIGDDGEWSREMLENSADHMDLMSEHFYAWNDTSDIPAHVAQITGNIKRIADYHRKFRKEIPGIAEKDIKVALDEWNYWYGPYRYGELGVRYHLKDALGIAAGLHEYFRNSDIYWGANYAQTVNVIGAIKTTKTEAEFATTGLPLMLYRKEFGKTPVMVENGAKNVDISAALTKDGNALTIGVVNMNKESVDLNFEGIDPASDATTWIITSDDHDPRAYNVPGEERNVDIEEAGNTDLTNTVEVEPLSITLFKVQL
ncbi:MAG: alpha-N-arabinofuranosidase [Candidatus Marinimicrobia bacterium]|nr:alpha-N-arabinofuranosidase [Candidatus Neomarinimicrobiota bacterium]MCF7880246.1 alpha-N-arabinofuranosidase [Candidatus Neomarinimicrobiota bacterium]